MSARPRAKPAPAPSGLSSAVAAALVALAVFAVFSGALRAGFLNWDDADTFLRNQNYRGLGLSQLRWMFGAKLLGHYIPVTWLTLGLDYELWGMNPFGYHLTSVLFHCANAAIFLLVARRLLLLAEPDAESGAATLYAGAAALLFAAHPLRAESVAWVTERRDVVSGFFYLLSILCYLRAGERTAAGRGPGRLALCVVFYGLSLLSKITGVALPVVLLAIDVYPSRRMPLDPRRWLDVEFRSVLAEKIPFFLLALPVGLAGVGLQSGSGAFFSFSQWGLAPRVVVALYSAAFYVQKTVFPWGLSPLYQLPENIHLLDAPFLTGSGMTAALCVAAIAFARRGRPAFLVAWLSYLAGLLPVSGLLQSGDQLAADRYAYIPCMAFAVLAAGAAMRARRTPGARLIPAAAVAVLGVLTWRQVGFWRDSEALWRRVLSVDSRIALAHDQLGDALAQRGRLDEAVREHEEALRLKPDLLTARVNLANALARRGDLDAAEREYRAALELSPGLAQAHDSLGLVLAGRGKLDEAIEHYRRALDLRPDYPQAHDNLGAALAAQGNTAEAVREYESSLRLDPDSALARHNLAVLRAELVEAGRGSR